jgi:hypothetical protein
MSDSVPQQQFKCFVVMPFSATEHMKGNSSECVSAAEWDHIYEKWIKPAVESFGPQKFRCTRSAAVPGNFIKGIVQDLYQADLVLADLTGSKPNVYYELGIRHALDSGTIMVSQDLGAVPSDLKSYYCFQYSYSSEHHLFEALFAKFKEQLHEKMRHFFQNEGVSDNPVTDFLGHRNAYLEERFEREKSELEFLVENVRKLTAHQYKLCEELRSLAKDQDREPAVSLVFDFYPFDLLLSRVVNTRWELLPYSTVQEFVNFVQMIRLTFLPVHQGWQILRINPTSEANADFFNLIEAVLADRVENETELMSEIAAAVREMTYSVTHSPKKTAT